LGWKRRILASGDSLLQRHVGRRAGLAPGTQGLGSRHLGARLRMLQWGSRDGDAPAPHSLSATEFNELLAAERAGKPFLAFGIEVDRRQGALSAHVRSMIGYRGNAFPTGGHGMSTMAVAKTASLQFLAAGNRRRCRTDCFRS
jgi:hypothetical protein